MPLLVPVETELRPQAFVSRRCVRAARRHLDRDRRQERIRASITSRRLLVDLPRAGPLRCEHRYLSDVCMRAV